ncbi:MAG: glycosyltransferase [Leptolyngbyaceae cyanobacterium RM2_2_4]|nr:glycosyltransferase [Leptolyngbyaceae cyanobacterium RM2_2_4]
MEYQKTYRIRYFSCWNKNDFIFSFSMLYWLLSHAENYDLVHTNTLFSPLISLVHYICDIKNVPYVITPRGMLSPWALRHKSWKKRFYLHFIERALIKKCRAIQALTQSEADYVIKAKLHNTTVVIPNGVNMQEFETSIRSDFFEKSFPEVCGNKIILFLGRIDPKKGLDLLAGAFARVRHQFPQSRLVIAGPDSINFLPVAKSFFLEAKCLDAVIFTGMLTGQDKLSALASSDIFVLPSYSEGFSMSILEGMASGLPCIITTGCDFPEAATAQAALVTDINAESIASALIGCLNDPETASEIGERGRQFVSQYYTWKKVC